MSCQPPIRSLDAGITPRIVGLQHFVNLISNRVTVADILEVRGIEIDGQNFPALSLRSWFNQTPHYLRSKFVGRQVWGDERAHGLNLGILGTQQVRRNSSSDRISICLGGKFSSATFY